MTKDPVTISADESVIVAAKLICNSGIGSLIVVHEDQVLRIVT
jgi:CBS domain-containing protein